MILKNYAPYVRDEIVGELIQRLLMAICEVEKKHKYITTNEIVIAGSKIGFIVSEEEEIKEVTIEVKTDD